jgi:hypothetical protein
MQRFGLESELDTNLPLYLALTDSHLIEDGPLILRMLLRALCHPHEQLLWT